MTDTLERVASGSVAIEISVSAWRGISNTGVGLNFAAGFKPPKCFRISASIFTGSTSPTATTAMRCGLYQSR